MTVFTAVHLTMDLMAEACFGKGLQCVGYVRACMAPAALISFEGIIPVMTGTTGGTFIHFSHTDSFFGYPHFIQRRMTGRAVLDLCQVDPMVES